MPKFRVGYSYELTVSRHLDIFVEAKDEAEARRKADRQKADAPFDAWKEYDGTPSTIEAHVEILTPPRPMRSRA